MHTVVVAAGVPAAPQGLVSSFFSGDWARLLVRCRVSKAGEKRCFHGYYLFMQLVSKTSTVIACNSLSNISCGREIGH